MEPIAIEQALYGSHAGRGYRFVARSPGFLDDWLPLAERLCTGFGERPAGVACPDAVFAQPLSKRLVAVVQASDRGTDDAGRPGALAFRLLVVPLAAYQRWGGDPFALADQFPPPWHVRNELPTLVLPATPPSTRTVAQVSEILKRPEAPSMLGGAQALVDGGRLAFERPAPAPDLIRGLWTLLPTSTRVGLWPATFAFGNGLRFHALATPRTGSEEFAGYLDGMQARDYPEGRYELGLQAAAESGDQAELDALFGRASREQVSKLIPLVFAFLVVLSLGVAWLGPNGGEPAATPKTRASHEVPGLPAPELCVTPEELRPAVLQGLNQLADRVHAAPGVSAEETLAHLDDALGTPDPARTPGPLREYGPIQRQLRVLLWKQGVPGFDDVALNTLELVERLRARLDRETKP